MNSRIYLRTPEAGDRAEFLQAARASGALHRPWISAPDSAAAYRRYLAKMSRPGNHAYLICRRDDRAIAGIVNLTNIIMGPFRSGYLGYYAFAGHAQQGLLGEGLKAVVRHAFGRLKMHRLEANIQPAVSPRLRWRAPAASNWRGTRRATSRSAVAGAITNVGQSWRRSKVPFVATFAS